MSGLHEIAGYKVMSTLGTGAGSTIYAVRDRDSRVFALKRVVKSTQHDQRFIDQAVHEHEIASRFNSPMLRQSFKLIRQRNFIRTNEVLVIMELVDGLTLEQHQPDTLIEACEICRLTAMGLSHMHIAGFVHADIKPNNILVTASNQVKLIDFGQSCRIGTIKQRIQGTPDYIAPEQVLRKEITPMTDVFNLGATMYWLFTRRHVPTMIPKGQAGMQLRSEDQMCRPPMEINPDVPPALSTLVMDCLEQDPIRRPRSVLQLADRLEIAASQLNKKQAAVELPPEVDINDESGIDINDESAIHGHFNIDEYIDLEAHEADADINEIANLDIDEDLDK